MMPTFDLRRYSELPFASTLNGSCSNVCPVKINIHEQIYAWRAVMDENQQTPLAKKEAMIVAGKLLSHPEAYRIATQATETALKVLPRFAIYNHFNAWGRHREVPTFHRAAEPLVSAFERSLKYMAGEFVEHPPSDFAAYLRQKFPQAKNICSAVPEYSGNRKPEHYSNWSDAADIDVTIVRSPLAIAETGSVLLTGTELLVNTIGFLAHDIVILLDPKDLCRPVTKYSAEVDSPESVSEVLTNGFRSAESDRPGAAFVSLPMEPSVKRLLEKIVKEREELARSSAMLSGTPVHPLRIVSELQKMLTSDTTLCLDMGSFHLWMARHLYSFRARQILISNGQQTLGIALPWAIAATLVRPSEKVLSISGDGGFLFSAMELETAVRLKSNLVHMILIDGSYDMVAEQEILTGAVLVSSFHSIGLLGIVLPLILLIRIEMNKNWKQFCRLIDQHWGLS